MRNAKRPLLLGLTGLTIFALLVGAITFARVQSTRAASVGFTRTISSSGTSSFASAPAADDAAFQNPEFPAGLGGDAAGGGVVDRSHSGSSQGNGHPVQVHRNPAAVPALNTSFDGLNFRQQRLANGGNQFSVEPPDQGLCAGNGFVVETINDVIRVFHTDGTPATGVVDLNTFYGYPAQFNRTTGDVGPVVTDPSCLYDAATDKWFADVLTLDVFPATGDFTGVNHLDLAVSNSPDPTGSWTIYRIQVQDDGHNGTPNHGCIGIPPFGNPAPTIPPTFQNACIGDYPHIGADANGVYLESNEYDFFGNTFHGSQIYAISKTALAALGPVSVTQFDTATLAPGGKPGFTLWPAQSPGSTQFDSANGGSEYFLSSTATDEAQCTSGVACHGTGTSNNIVLWSLTNTSSLNSSPALTLSNRAIPVDQYAIPARSNQQAGHTPLVDCINDTTHKITSLGPTFVGCWQVFFGAPPGTNEVEAALDSNDTRMQQVMLANGEVWGALDTDVIVNNQHQAGVEFFVVNPHSATLVLQDTVGIANNNLTYPAVGVTAAGRGVMAFTVLGNSFYPSAGYAAVDDQVGVGAVNIAGMGAGPADGFTDTVAFNLPNPLRPRWGDYGAAAVVGDSVWIASEYIAQTCNFEQYTSAPFASCGGTRASLGNWATRISKVTP